MADTTTAVIPAWDLRHRLTRALEFAGMKPADMAAYLDVSENTMRNYLSGRTKPRMGLIRIWALRCGTPFEWLANGDDPTPTSGGTDSGLNVPNAQNLCSTATARQAA